MNKIVNSFLFSLCCFLASCGNSDDPVAESSTMHITSCYVVNNNTLSENLSSPIGLYITTVDNKPYGDSYRNYASLVHGNWMMNAPVYVENKGLVYSYYPYSESDTSPIVSLDMTKQVDLLYVKKPIEIGSGSASLSIQLSHALSQIVVSVEGEEISSLSLTSSPVSGNFNICTGAFEELSTGEMTSYSNKILLVPHLCNQADLKIRLKGGKEYTYAISDMDYVQGESYTYKFKLTENREQLQITSVTVESWVTGSVFEDYLK